VDGLLVSIWFSLQIQNFIGIQTIILGVINWSVAGMILARSSSLVFSNNNQGNTEKGPTNAKIDSNQKKVVNSKKIIKSRSISAELLAPSTYAISGIFFLLGVIVASPPFFNDIAFNNKFERNDIEGMKRIGSNNIGNQVLLSVSLERATINDNGEESLQIARILTQKYPRSYYGWDVLNKLKVTPDDLRERANNEIRLIEPRYETSD